MKYLWAIPRVLRTEGRTMVRKSRKGSPIKVLLTGFGRFGAFRWNPTEEIVRRFDAGRLALHGGVRVRISRLVLPVHTGAFQVLERKVRGRKYDLILHLGLHSKARTVHVESRARNRMHFRAPDNRGVQIQGRKISQHGPRFLYSSLPFDAIGKELRRAKIGFVLSDNAGGFICNLLFYRSLQKFKGKKTLVGFFHVPQTKFCSMKKARKALDIVLGTCIESIAKGR